MTDGDDVDREELPDPDEIPDDRKYLDAEEIVENCREYVDVLEAELEMTRAAADALEDGAFGPDEFVERLPSPTPMEARQRGVWDDYGQDPTDLSLPEGDNGE